MLWLIGIALLAAYYISPLAFETVAILSLAFIAISALTLGVGMKAMQQGEV